MEVDESGETSKPLVAHRISSFPGEELSEATRQPAPISFLGKIDLYYFILPLNLYSKSPKGKHHLRFARHDEPCPLLLCVFLGLQLACIGLAPILIPGFLISGTLSHHFHYYILQAAVIIGGICTVINCLGIKLFRLPYQIGTGMLSVVSNSQVFVPVFLGCMARLQAEDATSIHDAFGKMLGTSAVCCLAYIALSLVPMKYVKVLFPPVICGAIITLIGIEGVIQSAQLWGGGLGCAAFAHQGVHCTMNGDVNLVFGSSEYLGLGVFSLTIFLLCELFGSPFLRHIVVMASVLVVYGFSCFFTKEGQHYVNGDFMDDTPAFAFLWTTTYKLGFDKKSVMPILGAYLAVYLQSFAVLTATLEESKIGLKTAEGDRKIQGGLLTSAIGSLFSVLATGLPIAPAPHSVTAISVTKQAPSHIGIAAGIWIILFGIFGKLLAFYLEVPGSVKGAVGTILIVGVMATGFKILCRERWNRRTCLIIFCMFTFGLARIVDQAFIGNNLWRIDDDTSDFVISFRFAVISILRVPFFLGGFVGVVLHLVLPKTLEFGSEADDLPETYEPVYEG